MCVELIASILVLLVSSGARSQHDGHNCQFDDLLEYEIEHEEGFKESLAEIEQFYEDFDFTEIWEFEEDSDLRRRLAQTLKVDSSPFFKGILEIPVIVHVLYNPNYQYNGKQLNIKDVITNERITSQLLRLNIDLLGLNDEHAPSIWSSLKANYNMTFKLHKIIRKETNKLMFNYETTDSSQGGSAVIDRDHYLNIYVAPLNDNYGFATFPNAGADHDAVSMNWVVFGDNTFNNQNSWIFERDQLSLGKVTTHEVGHWLFLHHTFGQKEDPAVCDTDHVDDTPAQAKPNYFCPSGADKDDQTKWKESCGSKDMWANYMSYTEDLCAALFTKGQLQRSLSIFKLESGKGRQTLVDYQKKTEWSEDNKFVNHIYFRVLPQAAADTNSICGPKDQLISDTPINTEISGKFVYGCYTLTSNSYVDVVTDMKIVQNMNEAGDGFTDYCLETNLYKADDPKYLCYKKGSFGDVKRMKSITKDQISNLLTGSTNNPPTTSRAPTTSTLPPTNKPTQGSGNVDTTFNAPTADGGFDEGFDEGFDFL